MKGALESGERTRWGVGNGICSHRMAETKNLRKLCWRKKYGKFRKVRENKTPGVCHRRDFNHPHPAVRRGLGRGLTEGVDGVWNPSSTIHRGGGPWNPAGGGGCLSPLRRRTEGNSRAPPPDGGGARAGDKPCVPFRLLPSLRLNHPPPPHPTPPTPPPCVPHHALRREPGRWVTEGDRWGQEAFWGLCDMSATRGGCSSDLDSGSRFW